MNEIISELINETARRYEAEVGSETPKLYYDRAMEIFVELIVKECLRIGKEIQSESVTNSSEEYNSGREMGIEVFMNHMKIHFGIE